ncbi:MAG: 3-methyl-2-oxobutanoate hydroxymethyltransferase [Gammaproteobacteria bacterium]|nr:3-methyl-2-oxobutanoate hydroxymethyltransferase [Gammaproteobacteria bacterium]
MTSPPYSSPQLSVPSVTLQTLRKMHQAGEKIAMLTAYDASFAAVLDRNGVDIILVGDSLGMVVQGHATTIPVTMNDMIYHTRLVARAQSRAMIMGDMPFMSYSDPIKALDNATRFMQEAGAQMVKLEGGGELLAVVAKLAAHNIPVCAHLGLQPQSVYKLGGYRVQGRDPTAAEAMVQQALAMQSAGADALLLECVPAALAKKITQSLTIPTIGIGAGADTSGQVLVLYDILGISHGRQPKFAKNFLAELPADREISIDAAVRAYVNAVKQGSFPTASQVLA